MRKSEKRKLKKQDRGIVDFMMVANHFIHSLREWILEMNDPRNQNYITYIQADLGYMAILKNVCSQFTMRGMEESFNEDNGIATLRILSGNQHLKEMPHYDTLNYYLEKLSMECLSDLRKRMVTSLIRGKQFNRNRLLGKYWRVIQDGTSIHYFKEKHEGKGKAIRFQWVTGIELTNRNLEEMIVAARGRWKIENEGFNNQKNGLYRIEHLNSKNSNAMKNHYLLTQISDILM